MSQTRRVRTPQQRAQAARNARRAEVLATAKGRRLAQEVGIDVTDDAAIVDLKETVLPIDVAPVNEVAIEEQKMVEAAKRYMRAKKRVESARKRQAKAKAIKRANAIKKARLVRKSEELEARNRKIAALRAKSALKRKRAQEVELFDEVDVDIEEPVLDYIEEAPVNDVVIPEPVVSPIEDEDGANLGGLEPQETVVAPEYETTAHVKMVNAFKLARLHQELGIEPRYADTAQVAAKIARKMNTREIALSAQQLSKLSKKQAKRMPSSAPKRAKNANIGKVRQDSTNNLVERLFL